MRIQSMILNKKHTGEPINGWTFICQIRPDVLIKTDILRSQDIADFEILRPTRSITIFPDTFDYKFWRRYFLHF